MLNTQFSLFHMVYIMEGVSLRLFVQFQTFIVAIPKFGCIVCSHGFSSCKEGIKGIHLIDCIIQPIVDLRNHLLVARCFVKFGCFFNLGKFSSQGCTFCSHILTCFELGHEVCQFWSQVYRFF